MIDHVALRQQLEAKLAGKLGVYTFSNGEQTPAVATIVGRNNYPPEGTQIEGVEVVIAVDLGVGIQNLLNNGYQKTWRATVFLKQWDDITDLETEIDDLIELLPQIEAAIAELPNIGIQPGSIKGLASERVLNNLQALQLTVFEVEMSEPDYDEDF